MHCELSFRQYVCDRTFRFDALDGDVSLNDFCLDNYFDYCLIVFNDRFSDYPALRLEGINLCVGPPSSSSLQPTAPQP